MHRKIKSEGRGSLFENPCLEPLTKCPQYISVDIYTITVIAFLVTAYQLSVVDTFYLFLELAQPRTKPMF